MSDIARPPNRPRASVVLHFTAGALLLITMAASSLRLVPLGGAYIPASLAAYGILLAVMILAVEPPSGPFGPANRVTLVRAVFVCLVGGVIVFPPMSVAETTLVAWVTVAIAALAEGLDAVDGWVARRRKVTSAFGARFDMETDSLFVLLLAILVWRFDKAGSWIIAAGALRYAFALALWLWPRLRQPLRPSPRRQAVCVAMVLALIVCLAPPVTPVIATPIAAAAVALLAWSFAVDSIWIWHNRPSP